MTSDQLAKPTAPPRQFFRVRPFFQLILMGLLFEVILLVLCFIPAPWGAMVELRNFARIAHLVLFGAVMLFPLGEGLIGGIVWWLLCGLVWLILLGAVWGVMLKLVTEPVKWLLARWGVSAGQKTVLGRALLAFGAIAVTGCAIVFALQARPVSFTPTPEVESTVNGNTAFALELYHRLETEPGNLFFSPFSISTALAMSYAGARGQTAAEMASALHFELPEDKLHPAFGALVKRINKLRRWGRVQLAMANSLWCQRDYKFTDAFINLIREHYGAEVQRVDFVQAPGAAAQQINQWVARRTNRKITDAAGPGAITPLTRLVVCNAIYFKGKWLH